MVYKVRLTTEGEQLELERMAGDPLLAAIVALLDWRYAKDTPHAEQPLGCPVVVTVYESW